MSEPLDPDLARALQEPARLVRADPALLDVVRGGGPAARSQLLALSSEAATTEDRYAAAAMLAALFDDRGPLDQAARGYGSTPPRELVALTEVPALRPALRRSLSSPVLTGLLEWATTPDAAQPPLELAMAARDLQLSDSSVLLSVARRADQVAQQGAKRSQQGPLARFSEVLRAAAEAGGGTASSSPTGAGRGDTPTPQEPTAQDQASQDPASQDRAPRQSDPRASDTHGADTVTPGTGTRGPEVTTTGIPASEMLDEDEQTDPWGADRPGTGVPVRDSISGPREDTPPGQKDGKGKIFDAERFWPMGPPRTDRSGTPQDGHDDAAQPGATGQRPGPQVPPREPSTNDLYFGAGSDRWANRDPDSEETRADDRTMARNWAITFGVIVAIILILVLLL